MSRDEDQEYFADGISEDIITDLSKVSALSVVARNTAFTFKGKHVDVPQVARQLGVSHVLEGSVRKAGNRVRITAQLIHGADGDHLWAERYDRDLDDIFALQDEISHAIVKALKVRLLPEEKKAITTRGTDNVQAYDLVLRARSLTGEFNFDAFDRALELLREAIGLDPHFLQAYRQLAATLDQCRTFFPERNEACLAELRELVKRTSELAPDDPFVTILRARQLAERRDHRGAMDLIEQVPEDYRGGFFWGNRQFFPSYVGRFGSALELARELVRLDPLDRVQSFVLQNLLSVTGRPDEAIAECDRCRDLPGNRAMHELVTFARMKGLATPEECRAQYQIFLACHGFGQTMSVCRHLEPVLDDPETARGFIREAICEPDYQDFTRMVWLALLAGYFDAHDEALMALRRAFVEMNASATLRLYMWMPVFRAARQDPRFKEILRDMGLYDYWRTTGNWGDFVRPLGDDDFEVIG